MRGDVDEPVGSRRKKVWIDPAASAAASKRLLEVATQEGAQELDEKERIIGTAPSADAFCRWAAEKSRFKCDFIKGNIRVRELAYAPHSDVQMLVGSSFLMQGGAFFRVSSELFLRADQAGGNVLTPDVAVRLIGQSSVPTVTPQGGLGTYPVIVVEVASSQTPRNLHQRAQDFLTGNQFPRVEVYVGLKRFSVRVDGSIAMLATLYFRPPRVPGAGGAAQAGGGVVDPHQAISFGTYDIARNAACPWAQGRGMIIGVGHGGPPLNGPGMPMYAIQIPATRVFSTYMPLGGGPVGVPPLGTPLNYTVDLFPIQTLFLQPYESQLG